MFQRTGAAVTLLVLAILLLAVRGVLPSLRAQGTNAATAPVATDAPTALAQGEEAVRERHIPEAVADFSEAIKLRPDWEEAYMRRAAAKERQNNIYGAMQDFSHAVALNPQDASAYERRGRMREISSDFSKAQEDFGEALQLQPSRSDLYFRRGVTRMILGQWDGALSDLQTFATRAPQMGNAGYAHLYLWYIGHAQGKAEEADHALGMAFEGQNAPWGTWTATIAEFLLSHVSQAELLDLANVSTDDAHRNRHMLCEAWFYVGLKALVAGDKTGAATDFQNCVNNGQFHLAEHEFASAKLKERSEGP